MSDLSDRLRELRGETSQAEMARQLNMPRQQWINYETGKNAPGAEVIIRICKTHACSSDWLLGLNKLSVGQKVSVHASPGGIAIGGNVSHVSGPIVAGSAAAGTSPGCAKCPFKRKLQALEKVLGKS